MSWWQNTKRFAGKVVAPAAIGYDYLSGKSEGEDDIRAAGGALSAGAGGWAGATQGAVIGATLGSAVPVVGTAAGGIIGGIVGSIGGSSLGGWAFDRADDFVRGNSGSDSDRNNNVAGVIAGSTVAAGVGAKYLNKGKNMRIPFNPWQAFTTAAGSGIPAHVAAAAAAKQTAQTYGPMVASAAGKVLSHPATKIGALTVGGYMLNDALGNPIGGITDAATGGATNFKQNQNDELGYAHEKRRIKDRVAAGFSGMKAEDGGMTLEQYFDNHLKRAEAASDPYGYIQTAMRAVDEQTNQLMENRGYRVGDYVMKQGLMEGLFNHQNNMAGKAIDGYWQNRAANNQTIAGMFRR